MFDSLVVLGVCGFSGSGKTTVIEKISSCFIARGLKVAVIKHCGHAPFLDKNDSDSYRFFNAGSDVVISYQKQFFFNSHRIESELSNVLRLMAPYYDLIFVEGYKHVGVIEKIWLIKDSKNDCPEDLTNVKLVLKKNDDRVNIIINFLDSWLLKKVQKSSVYAGILIGGKSSRMGRSKHLIQNKKETWLEKVVSVLKTQVEDVVLLGEGEVPVKIGALSVLPDICDKEGPLSGILSAMRWHPFASWIFIACDLPLISESAVKWLLSFRRPGVWAIIPQLRDKRVVEPLFAYYDFHSLPLLEKVDRPSDMINFSEVITPVPPDDISDAWININTTIDLARLNIGQSMQCSG